MVRAGKRVDLYSKIKSIKGQRARAATVLCQPGEPSMASAQDTTVAVARGDQLWSALEATVGHADVSDMRPHEASSEDVINVLFSSGTTGTPKAIPWTHITPLRWCPAQRTLLHVLCSQHLLMRALVPYTTTLRYA